MIDGAVVSVSYHYSFVFMAFFENTLMNEVRTDATTEEGKKK